MIIDAGDVGIGSGDKISLQFSALSTASSSWIGTYGLSLVAFVERSRFHHGLTLSAFLLDLLTQHSACEGGSVRYSYRLSVLFPVRRDSPS